MLLFGGRPEFAYGVTAPTSLAPQLYISLHHDCTDVIQLFSRRRHENFGRWGGYNSPTPVPPPQQPLLAPLARPKKTPSFSQRDELYIFFRVALPRFRGYDISETLSHQFVRTLLVPSLFLLFLSNSIPSTITPPFLSSGS